MDRAEHRLFGFITGELAGPAAHQLPVIVELIAATTNRKGLEVQAPLDQAHYRTGDWNYTLTPSTTK